MSHIRMPEIPTKRRRIKAMEERKAKHTLEAIWRCNASTRAKVKPAFRVNKFQFGLRKNALPGIGEGQVTLSTLSNL